MTFEIFGRIHKELSITGNALYEIVLAISERVNRKVQIIRLHWHATSQLQRIDGVTAETGRQIADQFARRVLHQVDGDAGLSMLDTSLAQAVTQVHSLKQTLSHVDTQIRELKLEAIHEDTLKLQQDLALRSARIERLTVARHAAAVGRSMADLPRSSSVHIASVLRGPFLLGPSEGLVFRADDIVVLIGLESELEPFVVWFTSQRPLKTSITTSA